MGTIQLIGNAESHTNGIFWLVAASLLMFVGSIVLAWIVIVKMPPDYLTREGPPATSYFSRHPLVRLALRIARNVFGVLFLIAGIVMLVTPGQGLLFIFLGATMIDLPGKKKVITRILQRPSILKTINKIRSKANKPPLELPLTESKSSQPSYSESASSTQS